MTWLRKASDWIRDRARRRHMTRERALAHRGEDQAHRFLQRRGYQVVCRNYRTPSGGNEVDLIAWDREELVFVEVKTRTDAEVSAPERAVDAEKQKRIVRAALDFSRRAKVDWGKVRFDIVSVTGERSPVIELYRNAFGLQPKP